MLELDGLARAPSRQLHPGLTGCLAANPNATQQRPQTYVGLAVLPIVHWSTRAAEE